MAKESRGWFIVSYKVPSNPSTARVTVWKKTKELGALPLQQSVYVLPNLPELKGALEQLKEQIHQFGGECRILEMASLERAQEAEIIEGFNRLRNQEYEEVLSECDAFLQEIEKESKAGKFYYAEVEENEKRLQGLKEWFSNITSRDFFGAELREKASSILKECEEKFDGFSQEVFTREDALAKDSKFNLPDLKLKEERSGRKKVREVYSRDQLLSRLKEIVAKLEDKTLSIGEEPVEGLPDTAALKLKYKIGKSRKSLGIEIEWQDSEGKRES